MNISAFTIYLWQLADNLLSTVTVLCFITGLTCLLATVFFVAIYTDPGEMKEERATARKTFTWTTLIFVLFLLLKTFVPSSNTIAMMVVIPKIAESKVIQQDLPDIYNAAVEALKSSLKK